MSASEDERKKEEKALAADLSSMGRVSHRIALIDSSERLQQVLDKLLPRLLKKIGDNHRHAKNNAAAGASRTTIKETRDKIHAKLVEILGHVMKRVRDDQACKIPCLGILELLVVEEEDDEDAEKTLVSRTDLDPFTLNLSLAFLTLGLPRCDREESEALLPRLLAMVGSHSGGVSTLASSGVPPAKKAQASQVAHLLLRAMEQTVRENEQKSSLPHPSSKRRNTATTTKKQPQQSSPSIRSARDVVGRCQNNNNPAAGGALLDLLLDALLYQPVAGNVPPAGLSQAGHERLIQGTSTTEKDWRAEMSRPTRLMEFKLAVLDFVTPTRRWAIFLDNDNNDNNASSIGLSRTILLLVVATGDSNREVAERASTYLKIHLDSFRGAGGGGRNKNKKNKEDDRTNNTNKKKNDDEHHDSSLGNMISLACAMLSLAIGQTNADSALSKIRSAGSITNSNNNSNHPKSLPATVVALGMQTTATTTSTTTLQQQQQQQLSMKRRIVSEPTLGALLSFVATKILEDHPHALLLREDDGDGDGGDNEDLVVPPAVVVGTLSVAAVQRTLSNLQTSSGLSVLRAKVYIAAAQLLNTLCIRLAPLLPSPNVVLGDLLAKSLQTACSVLQPVSSKRLNKNAPLTTNNEGNIAIRDACYGVVCSLSRSGFVNDPRLFSCGNGSSGEQRQQDGVVLSIDTATLLFGCAANEEENLRPRAVAALDALLGAYCRIVSSSSEKQQQPKSKATETNQSVITTTTTTTIADNQNPWSSTSSNAASPTTTTTTIADNHNPWSSASSNVASPAPAPVSDVYAENNTNETTKSSTATDTDVVVVDGRALSKALLPLLWTSSQQHSRPKACRISAARWCGDLLKKLDLIGACHLLCFLVGDDDVTASAIAREGLGLRSSTATNNNSDFAFFGDDRHHPTSTALPWMEEEEDGTAVTMLPDFGDFTTVLFPSNDLILPGGRPNYWEFSFLGKAAALKFGLACLLHDMYGGEDSAVGVYVRALTETIALFGGNSSAVATTTKEAMDLLDDCSSCLFAILSTSSHARYLLVGSEGKEKEETLKLSLRDMEALVLSAHSSRARRHLAGACGRIYNDRSLWKKKQQQQQQTNNDDDDSSSLESSLIAAASSQISRPLLVCATKLTDMQRNLFMIGEIHGAAFLGAQCVRAFRLWQAADSSKNNNNDASGCWEQASKILSCLGRGTMHSDEIIGNAFADALAIALSYSTLDAPVLNRQLYEGTALALVHLVAAMAKYSGMDHCDPIRATKLAHAAGICLASSTSGAGFLDDANDAANDPQSTTAVSLGPARLQCAEALFSLLGSAAFRKDEEIALVAGEALAGYADAYSPNDVTWSSPSSGDGDDKWPEEYSDGFANELPPHQQVLYVILRKIFPASSPHKRTACAPALLAIVARAAREVNSDKNCASRSMMKEIVEHLNEVQDMFITLLAHPKSRHLSRESCCLGLAACRGLANTAIRNQPAAAAAVVGSGGSDEDNNKGEGGGDNSVITVSDELNQRLLRAFGQTTNFGGSAFQETRAQAAERRATEAARRRNNGNSNTEEGAANLLDAYGIESEVGGASNMGEAALGAYREMASAAVSLGRPDILYALLILSVSHPVWFSAGPRERYSSSALLGEDSIVGSRTNAAEMRAALRPHLGKLLPRILRASNDPNKQTREQMSALWIGITGGGAESRVAITEHLLPTTDALVRDASNKLWRARVGACGALSDILVGRSWTDLGGGSAVLNDDDVHTPVPTAKVTAAIRLLRLWRVAMRALDDVRGNVRESGESLSRTVRALTIRLCDPSLPENNNANGTTGIRRGGRGEDSLLKQHERDASSAAATSLRWLIKHGLSQPCAEATGFCVSCLVGIVDVVRPSILQPLIPGLLRSLLFAMSGLEPAAFNFLQVRSTVDGSDSDSYDRLERLRLQMAQSGPLASAVTKCLDMLPKTDIGTQRAVIPELDASLRLSAGFATRAATADAVSTLCATCPNAFRFPGSSNTNPSVRLLRALYFASERERGQGARDKMVHALGNLASVCPGSSVRSLSMKACQKYNSSTGNNDDPASRRAAAAALRAVAVRASNQFSDGGQSDIWCRRVLPVAFLGRNDADAKVASLWKEVWEEGGSAANLAPAASSSSGGGAGTASENNFGTTIQERLLPHLVNECAKALGDVSWSRRVAGSAALLDLCKTGVLSPVPRRLGSNNNTKQTSSSSEANPARARRRSRSSSVALKACVKLLVRSRLWTGKSEVLKAAVKVAGNWASSVADGNPDDELVLFGWEEKEGETVCPWAPITVSPGRFKDDLFVGDKWFEKKAPPEESDVAVQSPGGGGGGDGPLDVKDMDIDDSAETSEVKLDFGECDKMAETDTEEIATDAEEDDPENFTVEAKSDVITFAGFCRFLIEEALPSTVRQDQIHSEEFLPYRAAAFGGFRDLMASCGSNQSPTSRQQKKDIYRMVSPKLIAVFDSEKQFGRIISRSSSSSSDNNNTDNARDEKEEPPLVVARAIDCFAASFWEGIGKKEDIVDTPTSDILLITRIMRTAGGILQSAWTVREASAMCVASIASKCHSDTLRQHSLISMMVECAAEALKDRKFWRVRLSGMNILHDLVKRVGSDASPGSGLVLPSSTSSLESDDATTTDQERQLLLEAMLPHKEDILKLTKLSLGDPEAKITALSSNVISTMSWWP